MKKRNRPIVIALPAYGFDPTEAAVTWKLLKQASEQVVFATPKGYPAEADALMVTGEGLDWWGWAPGIKKLKLMGLLLRANKQGRHCYTEMRQSPEFLHPIAYSDINVNDLDGLVLPGGHHQSIRPYLENNLLQEKISACMSSKTALRPITVAGICHGVLAIARSRTAQGDSVVRYRQLTALPWEFERKAWLLGRLFRFWDPHYYRTYLEKSSEPKGHWGVESEIKRYLDTPEQFLQPTKNDPNYNIKTDGLHRDSSSDYRPAWVVVDENLVTARWPGDVHLFTTELIKSIARLRQTNKQHEKEEDVSCQ